MRGSPKKHKIISIFLIFMLPIVFIGLIFFVFFIISGPVDSCLDKGGSWDKIEKLCNY